jgi:hypothetical protein
MYCAPVEDRTAAWMAFAENLGRAEALLRIFERGRKRGRPRKEDTQLTRSSVVFSIGALDAYLHDLVLEVVAREVPPPTSSMPRSSVSRLTSSCKRWRVLLTSMPLVRSCARQWTSTSTTSRSWACMGSCAR